MRRHRARAVCKARTVIEISASRYAPRKAEVEPRVKRMPLIVVQQEIAAVWRREIGKAAADRSQAFAMRISVRQVNPPSLSNPRRAHRYLPSVESCAVDGQREKDVGISDGVVVEVVSRTLVIVVYIEHPSVHRNCEAELMLLIAFATKRNKAKSLRHRIIEKRTDYRGKGWRLVILAPKAPQNPVQVRNANGSSQPRTGRILGNRAAKVRQPHSRGEREPGERLILIFQERCFHVDRKSTCLNSSHLVISYA